MNIFMIYFCKRSFRRRPKGRSADLSPKIVWWLPVSRKISTKWSESKIISISIKNMHLRFLSTRGFQFYINNFRTWDKQSGDFDENKKFCDCGRLSFRGVRKGQRLCRRVHFCQKEFVENCNSNCGWARRIRMADERRRATHCRRNVYPL